MKNISFLLGAGFSKSAGYPTARELNSKIVSLDANDYWISSDGTVIVNYEREENSANPVSGWGERNFFYELVKWFEEDKGGFNYEEFYDFLTQTEERNVGFGKFYEKFMSEFFKGAEEFRAMYDNVSNYLDSSKRILNQIVLHFLKDSKNHNSYTANVSVIGPYCSEYPAYNKFLNFLKKIVEKGSIVNVHTLNHDVFFEQFKNCDFFNNLSDGFEELGSPYFAKIENKYDTLMIRLQQYTGSYNGNYRFYKLHGSLNYYPYYTQNGENGYDKHLKVVHGVSASNLYKEVINQEGSYEYENCWINYHPDFLSGTTSKILRYKEPFYEKLFKQFEENIGNADVLFVIGYGCGDIEINRIIYENLPSNCKVLIIEPYPSVRTEEFMQKINGKILKMGIEDFDSQVAFEMIY